MTKQNETGLLSKSLKAADHVNYLGSPEVLDSLLEFWSAEFVERLQKGQPAASVTRKIASRLGRILLGKDEAYEPVYRWNEPGGIDEFCKRLFQFQDKTPAAVMYHAVLTFLDGLIDLVVEAGGAWFLEETWQTKRKQLITKYAYIFRGVSPGQVAEHLMTKEQNEQQQVTQ